MMNVCPQCGLYRSDKIIEPEGPYAKCPECGYKQPFQQLPLFLISGASGTGKSTICNGLLGKISRIILLDTDILWCPAYDSPETNYREIFETWLRLAKNISQSGRPVVLFGAGIGVSENIEKCIDRRYFSEIHYLAFVCSNKALTKRLLQRPEWRGSREGHFIEEQLQFNDWFISNADDMKITLIDTSNKPTEATLLEVSEWIEDKTKDYV